jgi:hypothetical protein
VRDDTVQLIANECGEVSLAEGEYVTPVMNTELMTNAFCITVRREDVSEAILEKIKAKLMACPGENPVILEVEGEQRFILNGITVNADALNGRPSVPNEEEVLTSDYQYYATATASL